MHELAVCTGWKGKIGNAENVHLDYRFNLYRQFVVELLNSTLMVGELERKRERGRYPNVRLFANEELFKRSCGI